MAFSKKGKEEAAKAALTPAPEAISELDAIQNFSEDPLEALLDEQSDEEFGDLEGRMDRSRLLFYIPSLPPSPRASRQKVPI